MLPITDDQKTSLHVLAGVLGLDKEAYKETLYQAYGVTSCTKLDRKQAKELMDSWVAKGVELGVWVKHKKSFNKHKHNNLADREGKASPAQIRKLEAMWKDVSYIQDEQERNKAFNTFLSRRFGISHTRFLESNKVGGIITTLEQMKAQKARKEDK